MDIEDKLVQSVKTAAEMGFGLSRKQLLNKTGKVVKSLKLKTPFKKGTPGKDWFLGLKARHPDITMKKPQKLSVTRARAMSRDVTREYFDLLKETLDKLKVQPQQIWNYDETNMQLEHNPKSVVGRKGAKIPGRVSNSKESVSVLGCGNATGEIMSPMVVVKGKTKRSLMGWKTEDAPPNTKWAFQSKSYMDQALGVEWFQNVFLNECGPQRPQLLIVDSHCSHEPLELLELAQQENITILSLPSHCTHHLQPWDKSMFAPLKNKYNTLCSDFMAESMSNNLSKQTWPGLFCKAWTSAITGANLVSGFASTGIYPFNPSAIPDTAYMPDSEVCGVAGNVNDQNLQPQNISLDVGNQQPDSEVPGVVGNVNDQNLQLQNISLDVGNQQNEFIVTEDAQAGVLQIQNNVIQVRADIHWPSTITEENSTVTLELPILGEDGVETNVTLPVTFEGTGEDPDLSNISLTEVESNDVDLPSEIWNADVEALFLPEKGTPKMVKRKSNAASSRILTSSEILQAKAGKRTKS